MKKIIRVILIFILILFTFVNISFAKSKFDIVLPSDYSEIAEDVYVDEDGNLVQMHFKKSNIWDDDYDKESLDEVVTSIYQKLSDVGYLKVVEDDIILFTENKYDCYEVVFKNEDADLSATAFKYYKYYVVVQDDMIFTLSFSSDDYKYFKSQEVQDIVYSLTIEDFIGKKQEIEMIWKRFFILGAVLVGLVIICGIINKAREKSIYKKSEMILRQQEYAKRKTELETKRYLEQRERERPKIQERDIFSSVESEKEKEKPLMDEKDTPSFTTPETIEEKVQKKKCPNCGKENEEFWVFCNFCGHKLDE